MEVRPGYKRTEIGVIPKDWEVVPIGDIAKFTSGSPIDVSSLHRQSSDYPVPVFGGNGIAGYTDNALVLAPCVVLGRVGQKCGVVYLSDGPAWITDNALYPKHIHRLTDMRFLALALEGARLNEAKNRNDLPLITQAIVHGVRIAWPLDVAEQRAIAAALSDVDALIAALDRLIAKKRAIKHGTMRQLLTGQTRLPGFSGEWEVRPVKQFGEIVTGSTPSTAAKEFWNGSIPWVTPTDITDAKDIYSSERLITHRGLETIRRLPANSVLVTCIASIGKNAVLKVDGACNQQINAIVPNAEHDADFLYYLIDSKKQYLLANAGITATSIISKRVFSELLFSIPPLPEQRAIAAVLSDMDTEIAGLEARREKTRALKQGMMQELLTGRIRLVGE